MYDSVALNSNNFSECKNYCYEGPVEISLCNAFTPG